MERQELENTERCLICSAVLMRGVERAYALDDEEGVLCFECAVQHGGEYDPDADRWSVVPDVSDVPIPRHIHP